MPRLDDPLSEDVPVQKEQPLELSVVMPCLNEAETLAACIEKVQRTFRDHGIRGEVVIADNGSSDGSPAIAQRLGACVVSVEARGYGSALMGGIAAAKGTYIVMGDADDSYDFSHVPLFLEKLRHGYDLVMGNRFEGGIAPHAMPMLHKYLGNPVLTHIGRVFFRAPCGDFHCGLRGFSKLAYERMGLRTTGMEFATEMVVKATLLGMRISEAPTTLSVDGRTRSPHLRTWRDGWRHLRFMLLYSPRWLFLYPGILLMVGGALAGLWLLAGPQSLGRLSLDVDTLVYAAMAVLVGFQAAAFATFTKVFGISEGLLPEDPRLNQLFRFINLEVGLVTGALLMAAGLGMTVYAVGVWGQHNFGELNPARMLRIVIPAALSVTLGFEVILCSFFLSVLGLRRR